MQELGDSSMYIFRALSFRGEYDDRTVPLAILKQHEDNYTIIFEKVHT